MHLGFLGEDSALYEEMSPISYLRFFARLYEVPKPVAEQRIEDALQHLQLDVRGEKKIGDLSKGMKRKVAIARSLVNDPDMVIYDEPASGLDPVVSAYILDLIRTLAKRGKTVIFSAHNLYHMERICDRVLILRKGQVVANGDMAHIREAMQGTQYVASVSVPVPGAIATEEGFELVIASLDEVKQIEKLAQDAGGRLIEVRRKELSLEEIFLKTANAGA
jgi:ABC-2 type transport system ATP-binding protein